MKRWLQFSGFFSLGFLLWALGPSEAVPEAGQVRAEAPAGNHKSYTETIPGTPVKFDMIAIPGGEFLMGSPPGEKDRKDDEGPQHPVRIPPFWMGKCEVTWDEFDLYWRAKPGQKRGQGTGKSQRCRRRHPADAALRRRDFQKGPRRPSRPRHHLARRHAVLPLAIA